MPSEFQNPASGFSRLDQTANPSLYGGCLDFINELPSTIRYKQRSYELLRLQERSRVLDAGCADGKDVFRLAALGVRDLKVFGIDASEHMIERAKADPRSKELPVLFEKADVTRLPFPDSSFDAVRVDRVLQHVAGSDLAVKELCRVLKPGGVLVAIEPDSETFTIDSSDRVLTRKILDLWCDSLKNGWAGRRLCRQFSSAGLENVCVEHDVMDLLEFAVADKVFFIRDHLGQACKEGYITQAQGEAWLKEISLKPFYCSITRFLVSGIKSDPGGAARTF